MVWMETQKNERNSKPQLLAIKHGEQHHHQLIMFLCVNRYCAFGESMCLHFPGVYSAHYLFVFVSVPRIFFDRTKMKGICLLCVCLLGIILLVTKFWTYIDINWLFWTLNQSLLVVLQFANWKANMLNKGNESKLQRTMICQVPRHSSFPGGK